MELAFEQDFEAFAAKLGATAVFDGLGGEIISHLAPREGHADCDSNPREAPTAMYRRRNNFLSYYLEINVIKTPSPRRDKLLTTLTLAFGVPQTAVLLWFAWDNHFLTPGIAIGALLIGMLGARLWARAMLKVIETLNGPLD